MDRKFEQGINGEPLGLPEDLFTDPGKYDAQIPFWKRTVGFIKQYEKSKPKGRDVLLDQMAAFVTKDLSTLVPIFDNFNLAEHTKLGLNLDETTESFIKHLERFVARRSSLPSWTPERIEQLMVFGLDGDERVSKVAEKLKIAIFNSPETVRESVDLHYNTAWAMVSTIKPEVREELFAGLCLERDWLKSDSFSALAFHFGVLEDGVVRSKYAATRKALDYIGHLFYVLEGRGIFEENQRVRSRFLHTGSVISQLSPDVYNKIYRLSMEAMKKHPTEIRKQIDFFSAGNSDYVQPLLYTRFSKGEDLDSAINATQKRYAHREEKRSNRSPEEDKVYDDLVDIITTNISPLVFKAFAEYEFLRYKSLGFEKLNKVSVQLPDSALLEIATRGYDTAEQRNAIIKEIYDSIVQKRAVNPSREILINLDRVSDTTKATSQGFIGPFDKNKTIIIAVHRSIPADEVGKLSSIIEFHRPQISNDEYNAINQTLKELRSDLRTKFTKSVGKRGYTVLTSDSFLRGMGYRMLTFRQQDKEGRLSVGLQLAGQSYEFTLDLNYGLALDKDFKRVISPQDQAWLELLTLSHLKKVMCVDEDNFQDELVGGQRQIEVYRKQMVHRTEHLRRLSPGHHFSTEAFSKCLRSYLPMRSLLEINRLRAGINLGGTIQTGIWTYVSGTEYVDTPDAKPVKVAFKNASEDIRAVIPLGQISPEEVARLEQEILGELNII